MTHTRKLALVALLAAISFLLMFFDFPILPAANFLKIEFSIVPILLGLAMLDIKAAFSILGLRSILKVLLHSQGVTTYIGLPMNIISMMLFVFFFAFIWKKKQTKGRFLLAAVLGTFALTVAMLLLNYVYAIPLYAQFAGFDIVQMIGLSPYLFAMVVPFNLLQGLIFSVTFALTYLPLRPIIKLYEK